ncbi:hypothetical protein [Georgenia sp. SUBG003]|uniref:hypothetical protein n=1 Tax=Georgenia sp. SUBG003 TaxID=1497974 RepID=UPI0004D37967|nr:hypothetical protein DA06_19005 [Georgenia sp. SUBG003]
MPSAVSTTTETTAGRPGGRIRTATLPSSAAPRRAGIGASTAAASGTTASPPSSMTSTTTPRSLAARTAVTTAGTSSAAPRIRSRSSASRAASSRRSSGPGTCPAARRSSVGRTVLSSPATRRLRSAASASRAAWATLRAWVRAARQAACRVARCSTTPPRVPMTSRLRWVSSRSGSPAQVWPVVSTHASVTASRPAIPHHAETGRTRAARKNSTNVPAPRCQAA